METAIKSPIDEGVTIGRERLGALGGCEWLLTNGLGGFAMGTVAGIPERRYHAWLVAATRPPLGRVVTLSSCAEWLVVENGADQAPGVKRYELSSYRFGGGTIHPHGVDVLRSFSASAEAVEWEWVLPGVDLRVTRGLLLGHGANAAMVRYTVQGFERRAWLEVRPLTALRDFHALRREGARFDTRVSEGRVEVIGGDGRVMMSPRREDGGTEARFVSDPQWWRSFEYERDRRREQDCREDLFSPGVFTFECGGEAKVSLQAWVEAEGREGPLKGTWEEERGRLRKRAWSGGVGSSPTPLRQGRSQATSPPGGGSPLVRAADQFVVKRESAGKGLATIIAGYPWFSDWGRDTFISMRGLLLATGRHKEALEALLAFAGLQRRGLIPNCFDDGSGTAQYNTVDASLWFVHAACEYLRVTGDRAGFTAVRGACLNVVDAYRDGTDFGIRMDSDGLIAAGNEKTQLTWMDAKDGDVVFTPRHGKAVEINALWYSGLLELAGAIEAELPKRARELRQLAELAGRAFEPAFWNAGPACLFDVIPAGRGKSGQPQLGSAAADSKQPPPGREGAQIRPNQIFAVSQPYSALSAEKRAAVVACVRERLLTPEGLRTLDPSDPGYRARFDGGMFERDGAYHNGTVWPWLIGPYCEAVLRVGEFSEGAKREVRGVLAPLLVEFASPRVAAGPVRQIPEVYDGDPVDGVRRADACMAQAWSVGEVVRVLGML